MWCFKDDDGNLYDKAYLDGYGVMDAFEDMWFEITIDGANGFHAAVLPQDVSYFADFNTIKWLKEAENWVGDIKAGEHGLMSKPCCAGTASKSVPVFVFDPITGKVDPHIP